MPQLCLCIAALVVRDTGLPESSALPALIQTFRESPPHPLASALSLAPLPAGSPDIEWLGPLVELMAVLPEECTAKKVRLSPSPPRPRRHHLSPRKFSRLVG